jgi:adenosylhomocysteine nucleosidase
VAANRYELDFVEPPAGVEFIKMCGGVGPRLAAAAMDRAGDGFDAVISTGMCGALDPELRVADVFVAAWVNGERADLPASPVSFRTGKLLSVDRIIDTVAAKRELFESGFQAVEMEAAEVGRRARNWGVPFYCIRAVSDTAAEGFELDLNAARDAEGRIRVARILTQAARRPLAIVPELFRLRRNAGLAARALGAFIATCDI